jgi:Putative addiction module component
MNLQYITDSNGQTTGIFIPIQEWNLLKGQLKDIEEQISSVPDWHKEIVRERMELYKSNPEQALDFDETMDEIEKELNV